MQAANDNWPLVLTRPQAAEMCQISMSTFDVWVRKGTLPRPIRGHNPVSPIRTMMQMAKVRRRIEPLATVERGRGSESQRQAGAHVPTLRPSI